MSRSQMNDSWDDSHLTEAQLKWIATEGHTLHRLLSVREPGMHVVDCGCGNARIRAALEGLNLRFFGIDIQPDTVASARERWAGDERVEFFDPGDFRTVLPAQVQARGSRFSLSICTGNTLGVLPDDWVTYLQPMADCSDAVLVSVCRRGRKELMARLCYYQKNGINCSVDWATNTVTSEEWGDSRAYNDDDILVMGEFLETRGFKHFEVLDVPPIGIALWANRY